MKYTQFVGNIYGIRLKNVKELELCVGRKVILKENRPLKFHFNYFNTLEIFEKVNAYKLI